MALYRAKKELFLDRHIVAGEQFSSDMVPGRNWEPLDDDAKAAVEARFGENGPTPEPVRPELQTKPLLAIPEDWRNLRPEQIINLARRLGAPVKGTKLKEATDWVEREIAQRGNVSPERAREAA